MQVGQEMFPHFTKSTEDLPITSADKHPLYHRILPKLEAAFPGCGTLFIFRDVTDVGRSFQRRFDDPSDKWEIKGYMAINYWCEAAHNFLAYQAEAPEECITVSFKNLFSGTFDSNMAQAHRLRDRLAQSWDVGTYHAPSLERIMKRSETRKIENNWSEDDVTAEIFVKYEAECTRPIWTVEQYHDMHAQLMDLDL